MQKERERVSERNTKWWRGCRVRVALSIQTHLKNSNENFSNKSSLLGFLHLFAKNVEAYSHCLSHELMALIQWIDYYVVRGFFDFQLQNTFMRSNFSFKANDMHHGTEHSDSLNRVSYRRPNEIASFVAAHSIFFFIANFLFMTLIDSALVKTHLYKSSSTMDESPL